MREQLLVAVRSRIGRFVETHDPGCVLSFDALMESTGLLAEAGDELEHDLEVCHAVGWLFWCRHVAGGQNELTLALHLLRPVFEVDPETVPEPVRHYLRQGASSADDVDSLSRRAIDAVWRALSSSDRSDLDEAIGLLRDVLGVAPEGYPSRARLLSCLNTALDALFQRSGDLAVLEEAIAIGRQAVTATPTRDPGRAGRLNNLGTALHAWSEKTGIVTTLEEAIATMRAAIACATADNPNKASYSSNLSAALVSYFEHTKQPAVLGDAIATARDAVETATINDTSKAVCLAALSNALQTCFLATNDAAALEESISAGRQAVTATADNDPTKAVFLSNLGNALRHRFHQGGELSVLDETIHCLRAAVAMVAGNEDFLSNLREALWARYKQTGQLAVLEEAVTVGRRTVAATPEGHGHRAGNLSNLGTSLEALFERTGDLAGLEEAITFGRQAAATVDADDPHRAGILINLSNALQAWSGHTGELDTLEETIALQRDVVASALDEDPNTSTYFNNLGNALRLRFELTGNQAALEEAVAVGRQAVEAAAGDSNLNAAHLSNLGITLTTWYRQTSSLAALDEAVHRLRTAVSTTPERHPDVVRRLSNLASMLLARYLRGTDLTDMREAIVVGRQAVEMLSADHPAQAMYQSNLGIALRIWSDRTGDPGVLEEAIQCLRTAVTLTSERHPNQAQRLANLSAALLDKFDHTTELAALDEAIALGRRAVAAIGADNPHRTSMLTGLGNALRVRYEHVADRNTLTEAVELFRDAASQPMAAPHERVFAGAGWGTLAMSAGEPDDAIKGFTTAVAALPLVAARQVDRHDAEHLLGRLPGLASDAAACALQIGDVDQAVALLEQGRGVLLTQALESRGDLADLRERSPERADRFKWLCVQLDAPDNAGSTELAAEPATHADPVAAASRAAARRRGLADELDSLIAEIRELPGMQRFLRQPSAAQLAAEATSGPVVLINVSQYRCDALILTPDGTRVITLPDLTFDRARQQTITFLTAVTVAHDTGQPQDERLGAQQTVRKTLSWLWDTTTGPVLDTLGLTNTPAEDAAWPRIWWSPTGPLTFLPIHAAGHHDERTRLNPRTVIDRVVSSYTPTVRALAHSRTRRSGQDHQPRTLVVAMPHTPNASDLPGTEREAQYLRAQLLETVILTGSTATRAAVLAELPGSPWAHFACHASSDPRDPSRSHLLVHGDPLSVLDISKLRLENAELAYLAACDTARTGFKLVDESVHITAAFQIAGYQSVIGTLWTVLDTFATSITEQFYTTLAANPAATRAAFAIHHATRSLRDRHPEAPSLWAAYIHAGR